MEPEILRAYTPTGRTVGKSLNTRGTALPINACCMPYLSEQWDFALTMLRGCHPTCTAPHWCFFGIMHTISALGSLATFRGWFLPEIEFHRWWLHVLFFQWTFFFLFKLHFFPHILAIEEFPEHVWSQTSVCVIVSHDSFSLPNPRHGMEESMKPSFFLHIIKFKCFV